MTLPPRGRPFQPGVSGNPAGKPKGTKNRTTLLREERRAIFDEEVSRLWRKKIQEMRPEYLGDQFMGKAPDKLEVSGELETKSDIDLPALAKKVSEELKKQKT